MIVEDMNIVNKFISVPRELKGLNCAAFVAGIVAGMLDSAEFPAQVTAHSRDKEGSPFPSDIIVMKFEKHVIEREA